MRIFVFLNSFFFNETAGFSSKKDPSIMGVNIPIVRPTVIPSHSLYTMSVELAFLKQSMAARTFFLN